MDLYHCMFLDRCTDLTESASAIMEEINLARHQYEKAQDESHFSKGYLIHVDLSLMRGERIPPSDSPERLEKVYEAGSYYYQLQSDFSASYKKLNEILDSGRKELPAFHDPADVQLIAQQQKKIDFLGDFCQEQQDTIMCMKGTYSDLLDEHDSLKKKNRSLKSSLFVIIGFLFLSVLVLLLNASRFRDLRQSYDLLARQKSTLEKELYYIHDLQESEENRKNTDCSSKSVGDAATIVYVAKSGDKYHTFSCSYLSSSKISISLSDAISQGYTPCNYCNPP